MNSLRQNFNALVIGSTGGIGSAFVRNLKSMKNCSKVFEAARSLQSNQLSNQFQLDITNENSIKAMSLSLKECLANEKIDLIVNAVGILQLTDDNGNEIDPEKSLSAITPFNMQQMYLTNAIGPTMLFKHLNEFLSNENKSVFCSLSARVGSIGDNKLGGWTSYRYYY